MEEGEVDMPLKFKYENFLSLKCVCIRETKNPKSEFMYSPHYYGGNVLIIKTKKSDAESTEQWVSAKWALHQKEGGFASGNKPSDTWQLYQ